MATPPIAESNPAQKRTNIEDQQQLEMTKRIPAYAQDPSRYIPVPNDFACKTCVRAGIPCHIDSLSLPWSGRKGWKCASCFCTTCDFYYDSRARPTPLVLWLDKEVERRREASADIPKVLLEQIGSKRPRDDSSDADGVSSSSASSTQTLQDPVDETDRQPPQKVPRSGEPRTVESSGEASTPVVDRPSEDAAGEELNAPDSSRSESVIQTEDGEIVDINYSKSRKLDPVLVKLMASQLDKTHDHIDSLLDVEKLKYNDAIEIQQGLRRELVAAQEASREACKVSDGCRKAMESLEMNLNQERLESAGARATIDKMKNTIQSLQVKSSTFEKSESVSTGCQTAFPDASSDTSQAATKATAIATDTGALEDLQTALKMAEGERDEYRGRLIAMVAREKTKSENLEARVREVQDATNKLTSVLQETRLERSSAIGGRDKAVDEAKAVKKECEEAQRERAAMAHELKEARTETGNLAAKVEAAAVGKTEAERIVEEAQGVVKALVEDLGQARREIDDLRQAARRSDDEVTQMKEARDRHEEARQVEPRTAEALVAAQVEIGRLANKLVIAENARVASEQAAEIARKSHLAAQTSLEELSSDFSVAQADMKTLNTQVRTSKAELDRSETTVRDLQEVCLNHERALKNTTDELEAAQSTISNLSADMKEIILENQSLEEARDRAVIAEKDAQLAKNAIAERIKEMVDELDEHAKRIQTAEDAMTSAQSDRKDANDTIATLQQANGEADIERRDALASHAKAAKRARKAQRDRDEAVVKADTQSEIARAAMEEKESMVKKIQEVKENFSIQQQETRTAIASWDEEAAKAKSRLKKLTNVRKEVASLKQQLRIATGVNGEPAADRRPVDGGMGDRKPRISEK